MNYNQLMLASEDDALLRRLRVAVIVAADNIRVEPVNTPLHVERLKWARSTMLDPVIAANRLLWSVLAQHIAKTLTEVRSLDDAAVQTSVDAAINLFAE